MGFEDVPKIEKEEAIPTPEEIMAIFQQLLKGSAFTERRRCEDEKGLYIWEIIVPTDSGTTEYFYARKGPNPEGGSPMSSAIHMVSFDQAGMYETGYSVAILTDGKWKITP